MDTAEMVRQARTTNGLSKSALARASGVATSTISRIEDGTMDPTVHLFMRVMHASGQSVRVTMVARPHLAKVAGTAVHGDELDWTQLRALVDGLTADPLAVPAAIATAPTPTGNAGWDALFAGLAEKLAHDVSVPVPPWTVRVPGSPEPVVQHGTPRMIARARREAPPEWQRRNIWLSRRELWRDQ
ncbi:MAG: helix-turn-helix domain-containing protein [Propionibacteriales bacterium]|nr:helix-turn-helix domain-containing protein [Propionibacteriales bacterium]